jgi:hypothetical protein
VKLHDFPGKTPRLSSWALAALALLALVAAISPAQAPVVLYKSALVTLGAVLGYWLDRALYPYARPHELIGEDWIMSLACLRRALIVIACVLGLTLGL